ncbi:MAG: PEGA domain-containing protein [Myxococcota bacterium]
MRRALELLAERERAPCGWRSAASQLDLDRAALAPENVPPRRTESGEVAAGCGHGARGDRSVPAGADILIDGHLAGQTPMTVSWDPSSEATVQLRLEGHEPAILVLDASKTGKMLQVALVPVREKVPRPVQLIQQPPEGEDAPPPAEPPPPGDDETPSLLKRHNWQSR